MKILTKKLIYLADSLDKLGLQKEANWIDSLIRRAAISLRDVPGIEEIRDALEDLVMESKKSESIQQGEVISGWTGSVRLMMSPGHWEVDFGGQPQKGMMPVDGAYVTTTLSGHRDVDYNHAAEQLNVMMRSKVSKLGKL